MKILFICLYILLSEVSWAKDFSGSWNYTNPIQHHTIPLSIFSLKIKQSQKEIKGTFCYVSDYGNRIDCDETSTISGIVISPNVAQVSFNSSFGATDGKARITLKKGKLIWNLLKEPRGGEYYILKQGVLIKN